jgi:hypothetical protein
MRLWIAGAILLCLGVQARPADADWVQEAVQVSCDAVHDTMEIRSFEKSELDQETHQPGFSVVDKTQATPCRLRTQKVEASVEIVPPGNDACEASGSARLISLLVRDVELVENTIEIVGANLRDCLGRAHAVDSVKLSLSGTQATLSICPPSTDATACEPRHFDIAALAKEQAGVDHHLDDPAMQTQTSATKLPPDQDEAKSGGIWPAGSSIPACIHRVDAQFYLDSARNMAITGAKTPLRYGRVAGKQGEHVAIRPSNPQLGAASGDDRAMAPPSVLPGDRVTVARICGDWTYVAAIPRRHAAAATVGWIETVRLYGLDPARSDPDYDKDLAWYYTTPLARAAAKDDVETLRTLLANGADPNVAQERTPSVYNNPLWAAISVMALRSADLLLASGANPNKPLPSEGWYPGDWNDTPLVKAASVYAAQCNPGRTQCDLSMIRLLLERGAKPNTRGEGLFFLASSDDYTIADPTALDIAAYIGSRPLVELLLAHGADPMLAESESGRTPAAIGTARGFAEIAAILRRSGKGALE